MPIASPPLDYQLQKPGSVGLPLGSLTIHILQREGDTPLRAGETGEIALSGGAQLFDGYGGAADSPRLFRTGDLGHVDADGWLFVTGRVREMINRGGEVLSPLQVCTRAPNRGRWSAL